MDWRDAVSTWDGDIASIRPLGDFVLVKPIPEDDSLIIDPKTQMTRDGRWRTTNREKGNRMGTVVATGPGDRLLVLKCHGCGELNNRIDRAQEVKAWKCSNCGSKHLTSAYNGSFVCSMHVQPGDTVVYPSVPANEFKIDGDDYVFLHEECHVLAVIGN